MKKVNINFIERQLEDLDKEIEQDENLASRSAVVRLLVKEFLEKRKELKDKLSNN